MYIDNIRAKNFRNYEDLDLHLSPEKNINIIAAPNGMGKSNLLEMIYYFSYLRSFRNNLDSELIKKKEKSFFLHTSFLKNSIKNNISIKYESKKDILLNNKKVRKFSELLGVLLSILFCSEDIFIINGSPSIRRKFFDIFISIIDAKYLHFLKKYQTIIKQKNFVLKNNAQNDLLSVYNFQLAQSIFYLQKVREQFINRINSHFQEEYSNIGRFNEKVKIIYSPSIKPNLNSEELIAEFLNSNIKKETDAGHSIFGVHRDNYFFLINGIGFSKYASFGQTRLAALVLKLVQADFYKEHFNANPVLLLDDVILELDKHKKERFLNKISEYNQIFITVTDKKYTELFTNKDNINIIEVENGKIQ